MANFKDIRTAVIGVGSMGRHHARVYSEISNLVYVVDLNEQMGKEVAEEFGAQWVPNYSHIIGKVDVASIVVPTTFHRDLFEALVSNNIHTLVEKPLANSTEECLEMIDISNNTNLTLGVGHIERHNEVIKFSKEHIENGTWGSVKSITARRFSSFPRRITDVGVMLDLTIHDADVISYLLNLKPSQVFTLGGVFKNDKFEDNIVMLLDFPNQISASCQTSWLTPNRVRDLSIISDTHQIFIDYLNQEIRIFDELNSENPEIIKLNYKEPLRNELINFLESVKGNSSPLVSLKEGMEAMKIVEAGLKSLHSKTTVKI